MKEITPLMEHSILGAVIGALFVVVGWFLRALSRKDEQNQEFIQRLLNDDREERSKERESHASISNRLGDAINDLTRELRKK